MSHAVHEIEHSLDNTWDYIKDNTIGFVGNTIKTFQTKQESETKKVDSGTQLNQGSNTESEDDRRNVKRIKKRIGTKPLQIPLADTTQMVNTSTNVGINS